MHIFIIADDANTRGDLFNERMKDLVHALGYEVTRTNIHKPGREIDIIAQHPLESRRAIVECKAKKEKIGGGDVNKFFGALDAERTTGEQIAGYFASISGFTDSAIEQEYATGRQRVALLGPQEIQDQLIKGRIIAPRSVAAFKAGTTPGLPSRWSADGDCDIVAHESGWLWIVYFKDGGARQAFTLVHADGDFPAQSIAAPLAAKLSTHEHLGIPYLAGTLAPSTHDMHAARNAYYDHLSSEYGNFTLEGFPVDQYVGSKSIGLEELYVSQTLEEILDSDETFPDAEEGGEEVPSKERLKLSAVLEENTAIAVLGMPGSGKTTLVKRLATSYAAPSRRLLVGDSLPDKDWVPLVLRCRDIQNAKWALVDLLRDIPRRAEIPQYEQAFSEVIDSALRDGSALILIDGIDEFPDARERARFLQRLRTFMSTYPLCTLIITSREAGFREVSGFVSERFKRYRISDLSNEEIHTLTVSWHTQAYGSSQAVTSRATSLADQIIRNDRVRRLALNPLLLTTLLLVQRWIGDLPRKRSVLYEKAIELLLMTWNVEGFEPIDLDEAKPHLAFLAHTMTASGKQQICQDEMLSIFAKARATLPEVLGYSKLSSRDLLRRIELRSSLVSQVGQTVHDGKLQPTYEFKHLTFQEYLTAMALVSGWHEDAVGDYDPLDFLGSVLSNSSWHEIISLYGVLSGRKGSSIVSLILSQADQAIEAYLENDPEKFHVGRQVTPDTIWILTELLYKCLEDEVQITPDLADKSIDLLIEWMAGDSLEGLPGIITSRYGQQLLQKARKYVLEPIEPYNGSYIGVLGTALLTHSAGHSDDSTDLEVQLRLKLTEGDAVEQVAALSVLLNFSYELSQQRNLTAKYGIEVNRALEISERCLDLAVSAISDENPVVQATALWAVVWTVNQFPLSEQQQIKLFPTLRGLLTGPPKGAINGVAGWVLSDAIYYLESLGAPTLGESEKARVREYLQLRETWLTHETRGAIVLATLSGDRDLRRAVTSLLKMYKDSNSKFCGRILDYRRKTRT